MANVLEAIASKDLEWMAPLADELEGVLSEIAYAGITDPKSIKEEQLRITKEYGKQVELFKRNNQISISYDCENDSSYLGICTAVNCIIEAYDQYMRILDEENMAEEAEDTLHSCLIFPEEEDFSAENQ